MEIWELSVVKAKLDVLGKKIWCHPIFAESGGALIEEEWGTRGGAINSPGQMPHLGF